MPSETFAERQQRSLSYKERQAAVLLYEDGWTQAELSLALNTTDQTVQRALQFEGASRGDA